MGIDLTTLPHPLAYGLGTPYGPTLMQMAGNPQRLREYLMAARLPYAKEHDHSLAIQHMVHTAVSKVEKTREGVRA